MQQLSTPKWLFQTIVLLLLVTNYCLASSDVTIKSSVRRSKSSTYIVSCLSSIRKFKFNYTPNKTDGYYATYCNYPPALGSVLLCAHELGVEVQGSVSDMDAQEIFKAATKRCESYTHEERDWTYYQDQYENATDYYVPITEIENASLPIYSPTTPNMKTTLRRYKDYRAYYFNVGSGTWFSVGICGYFLLLIIVSAIHNFFRETTIGKNINGSKFSKLCQKYIMFPSILPNGKFTQAYGWKYFSILFPNRIQFLTDFFLFAFQVAFYCVDYRQDGVLLFTTERRAWQRFLADRSGIMAFGKIPLLVLFAGRNNLLLAVTGWSYTTFLHFHKIVAYWMVIDAIIHSVGYTILVRSRYQSYLHDLYFACGVAATIIGSVMIIPTFHPFRNWYYEYFLVSHVVFALAFIIMCWYHCRELGWLEWLIAACAVWFFDRLLRVIRMAGFGYRTATITTVGDELFKVTVPKPSWWYHNAGTYCYVYFAGWIFWENHPFTCVLEGDNICAYIRVKKGVTYRIWKRLLKNNGCMSLKVCIEGPYGGSGISKLAKYDEALLLAGGSGAPGILEAAGTVTNGKMVWVAPTLQHVKAYQPLIEKVKVELNIYITREQGIEKQCLIHELFDSSDSENLSSQSSDKDSNIGENIELGSGNGKIKINYGRPNISEIIDSTVTNTNSKSVGIMSCGPPVMSDEIRNLIANKVTCWEKSVDYFDEFQIW